MNDLVNKESFNIGEAARRSGVSAKMVRHYESLGLLPEISRTDAGYRIYGANDVHTLRFIKRSRDLGFGMAEIAELLKLWQNRTRSSRDVRRIAMQHVTDLEHRMSEMQVMKNSLETLIRCCDGDHRPECPILNELGKDLGPMAGNPAGNPTGKYPALAKKPRARAR